MADFKNATSLVAEYAKGVLPLTTEATVYTVAPAGKSVLVQSLIIKNSHTASVTIDMSHVHASTGGQSNRIAPGSIPAGATVVIPPFVMDSGDFLTGVASVASVVNFVLTGLAATSGAAGAPVGIQDDHIGKRGRSTASGTVTASCDIGSGNSRGLFAGLVVAHSGWQVYSGLTTLTVGCTDGPLTPLVSIDFGNSGQEVGSLHLFARADPAINSTQALTGTVAKAGLTIDSLQLFPFSLAGVDLSSPGVATFRSAGAQAMNLPIASAAGHRILSLMAFDTGLSGLIPQDLVSSLTQLRVRDYNWTSAGSNPSDHFAVLADADGVAGTPTISDANSMICAGIAIDIPAA